MALPRATISVWFVVTRAWLLLLVFHWARKLGVVRKPTRGVLSTRSAPARHEGRSKTRAVVSEAEGCRTVTICHCRVSAAVTGAVPAAQPGGRGHRGRALD